jgi:hypothetical protein
MHATIAAIRPVDVAIEVEALRRRGYDAFVLRAVAHGGMLDQERLGAARYTAGLQAEVVLEPEADTEPAAVAESARRR